MPGKMRVDEIQKIVLPALRRLLVDRVLPTTIYAFSDDPEDGQYYSPIKRNLVICKAIMNFQQFQEFQKICNAAGLWINFKYAGYGLVPYLYIYQIAVVEKVADARVTDSDWKRLWDDTNHLPGLGLEG